MNVYPTSENLPTYFFSIRNINYSRLFYRLGKYVRYSAVNWIGAFESYPVCEPNGPIPKINVIVLYKN